jgi:hypothetical protein
MSPSLVEIKKDTAPKKRKYQPIWERIKKNGRCTIQVHPAMMDRVVKGVCKEKNQDLGFKVMNDDDHFWLEISRDIPKKQITFILRQSLGLEERKVV